MAGNMHTCRACGKHYYACDPCDQRLGKSWRATYCCEEHREAYQVLIAYVRGGMTKAEAKEALSNLDAQEWTESTSYPTICEIFADDTVAETVVEEPVEEVVEEVPMVEETVREIVEEAPVETATSGQLATEVEEPVEVKTTYATSNITNNWNGKNNHNNYNNYKSKKRR